MIVMIQTPIPAMFYDMPSKGPIPPKSPAPFGARLPVAEGTIVGLPIVFL
jgi:hypothetical protein